MKFNPLVFSVDVNGQNFRFAALTERDIELLAEKEEATGGDAIKLRKVHAELLASAISRVEGVERVTAEDLLTGMPTPIFRALFFALVKANGMKLEAEARLGESALSSNSCV